MTGLTITLLAALLAGSAQAQDAAAVNPHGSTEHCASCHESAEDDALPGAIPWVTGHPDQACQQCHGRDPHEVATAPTRAEIPAGWPLFDGLLACLSCHDEPACDGRSIAADNQGFLRGGPYALDGDFCARCHTSEVSERYNPHAAMLSDAPKEEVCTYCHLEVPDAEKKTGAELKVSLSNICLGCHSEMPHAGSLQHHGPVPAYMLGHIEAAGLPLADGGIIICRTCHDPHPRSTKLPERGRPPVGTPVVPEGWATEVLEPTYAERSERLGVTLTPFTTEPDFLRRSLTDGQLCLSCHALDQIESEQRGHQ